MYVVLLTYNMCASSVIVYGIFVYDCVIDAVILKLCNVLTIILFLFFLSLDIFP